MAAQKRQAQTDTLQAMEVTDKVRQARIILDAMMPHIAFQTCLYHSNIAEV